MNVKIMLARILWNNFMFKKMKRCGLSLSGKWSGDTLGCVSYPPGVTLCPDASNIRILITNLQRTTNIYGEKDEVAKAEIVCLLIVVWFIALVWMINGEWPKGRFVFYFFLVKLIFHNFYTINILYIEENVKQLHGKFPLSM